MDLELTIGYASPWPKEECILAVTGLDRVPMSPHTLEQALRFYFKQPVNGGHDMQSCIIADGTAYIDFPDPNSKFSPFSDVR